MNSKICLCEKLSIISYVHFAADYLFVPNLDERELS